MSGPSIGRPGLSRRSFSTLALGLAALPIARRSGFAAENRGFGGTGAAAADPAETLGQDRGIGGTGVIGTIRQFGSIVVNDLHVRFSSGVRVAIDGRAATSRDLRLGHVVHLLARSRGNLLVTRAIVVRNLLVGPVDAVTPRRLVVLGQQVDLEEGLSPLDVAPGETVAVSGIWRFDGTIVASLIEARPPGLARLHGPLAGEAGVPTLGTLRIAGLTPTLAGRRVSLIGTRQGGTFLARRVEVEPRLPFAAAAVLSVEDYVARVPNGIRFGSGLQLPAADATEAVPADQAVRAVLTAVARPGGLYGVQSLRLEHDGRAPDRGHHRARGLSGPEDAHSQRRGGPDGNGAAVGHAGQTGGFSAGGFGGEGPGSRSGHGPGGPSGRGEGRSR